MKSIIFVTTTTSGSASLWRILSALLTPTYQAMSVKLNGAEKSRVTDLNPNGCLYMIRGMNETAAPIYNRNFRYIVNFRDPRDRFCNQYHWLTQHPANQEGEKAAKTLADRKKRHDLGIDANVLRIKTDSSYGFTFELQAAAEAGGDILFVSYAQLCCAFDTMIDRISKFVPVKPSPQAAEVIRLERPENLSGNPNWIGQDWTGTDSMPGRYRKELTRETILTVNQRFAETLERMKSLDLPELRHLYD